MIKVLFVCLGNICRSPMAEAVMRHLVQKKDLNAKITVDSAGTGGWHHGEEPHQGTLDILNRYEISATSIFARQVKTTDLTEFSYIIVMDDNNMTDLAEFGQPNGDVHVGKLCDFIENTNYENVPDPYYTGDFDETYELVLAGCRGLLRFIREKEDL